MDQTHAQANFFFKAHLFIKVFIFILPLKTHLVFLNAMIE